MKGESITKIFNLILIQSDLVDVDLSRKKINIDII